MKPLKLEVNNSDCKSIQILGRKPLVTGLQYVLKNCCLDEVFEAETELNAQGEVMMRKILNKVEKDDECIKVYQKWQYEYLRGREDERLRQIELAQELPGRQVHAIQELARRQNQGELPPSPSPKRRLEEEDQIAVPVRDEIDQMNDQEIRKEIMEKLSVIQKSFFEADADKLRAVLRHLKKAAAALLQE